MPASTEAEPAAPAEQRAGERRAHNWRNREGMAWVSLLAVVASMAAAFALEPGTVSGMVIESGQWACAVVVVAFVGGKAAVEGLASRARR